MNREVHVRIWERPEVRALRATRQTATSLTTQPWSAVERIADTQLARPSVLLGLRHALAGILKALHLTGSEPQSRMWRDGNSYSATKDHTRSGPSSSMLSCGPTRHKIIANRLAFLSEESVSVGHRRHRRRGQSGAPTHARLYHRG